MQFLRCRFNTCRLTLAFQMTGISTTPWIPEVATVLRLPVTLPSMATNSTTASTASSYKATKKALTVIKPSN